MAFVAGVDSSTQSTKVEIRDLDSGEVVGRGVAGHASVTPPLSEQDPTSWWSAFESAWEQAMAQAAPRTVDLKVSAISVAAQQHGMVALDADDQPVHPAKLWNDTESAPDAEWLREQLASEGEDGAAAWAAAVGSVPVAAFTVTKLSWLHRTKPEAWADLARVLLPHDYLTHRLTGAFTTDRGDASGTGYWSPTTGDYQWDILALIDSDRDWPSTVPTVLGPLESAGTWNGMIVGPGTGDNMAAALGVGLR
ncbi:MAG: xylulose kinase, partial [Actinobacteria bacterium]